MTHTGKQLRPRNKIYLVLLAAFLILMPSFFGIYRASSVIREDYVINGVWWDRNAIYSYLKTLQGAYPDILSLTQIGTSVKGIPIYALRLGHGSKYLIIDGTCHGNEKTGTFGALSFANFLLKNYMQPYWNGKLAKVSVIIVPILNPDGYDLYSSRSGPSGTIILNGRGQNINRDFPPSGDSSEPETQAYKSLWSKFHPRAVLSHHTGILNEAYWSVYQKQSDDSLAIKILQKANSSFCALGYKEKNSLGQVLGKMYAFSESSLMSTTSAGAAYLWQAMSITVEFWRPYESYATVGLNYFLEVDKAFLEGLA